MAFNDCPWQLPLTYENCNLMTLNYALKRNIGNTYSIFQVIRIHSLFSF